jgi:hypothetical protein
MSNYHEKYLKYKTKYLNLKNQLGGAIRNNMNHRQQRGGSLSEIILLILAQYGYFKPTFDYEHVYKEMLKCEDYFNVLKNKFNTFVIQQIVNNNKHIQTAKSTLFQGIIVQRLAARSITDINEELYTKAEYLQSIGECAAAVVLLDKAISYGHLPSRALKAHMLLDGRKGVAKDWNGAFELVEEGARLCCHHWQGATVGAMDAREIKRYRCRWHARAQGGAANTVRSRSACCIITVKEDLRGITPRRLRFIGWLQRRALMRRSSSWVKCTTMALTLL